MEKHYAVILTMLDEEKNAQYRPEHLQYLEERSNEGAIFAYGRFLDGAGGLIIYKASTFEKVENMVKQDPYITHGARKYEIHEWGIVLADS